MLEKIQKNYKSIIKYALMLIAIFLVVKTGIQMIQYVLNRDLKSYHVVESVVETLPANENYTTEFLCVGKEMDSIQIEAVLTEDTTGVVFYQLMDINGNVVLEKEVDVSELCRDGSGLYIDVKDMNLVQGQYYTIHTDFSKTENLQVVLGSGKLSIRQFFEPSYTGVAIGVIIGFVLLAIFWLFYVDRKGYNEKVFLVTSLVVGIMVAIFMVPCSKDDEYRHFIRVYTGATNTEVELRQYQGIEHGIMTGGQEYVATVPYQINELRLLDYEANYNGIGYFPEVNNQLCLDKLVATLKTETTDEVYYVSCAATALRSDIYYWPQIIAVQIAAFFGVADLLLYYAARIGQVIVCVFMETLAIKIAPRLKEIIWLISFVPSVILLKSSCNCDGLMISEIVLLVAIAVWFKESKTDVLSVKGLIGIVAYAVLTYNIMVMKIPYILISIGMLIYLGRDNFVKVIDIIKANKKTTILAVGIVLALGILVFAWMDKTFIWNLVYSFLPEWHFNYILDNPGYILRLFINKWFEMFLGLYVGMKGSSIISYPIAFVLLITLLKRTQPLWKRFLYACLFAVMIMIIVLVGYTMTPPDYGMIWGISYRYLLPFVIIGALCLPSGNEKTEVVAQKLIPICIFLSTASTLMNWLVGGCL